MILVDLPARMVCIEEGCTKSQPGSLCLNTAGGFGFKPSEDGWQVLTNPQQMGGPFLCRCPEHKKAVIDTRLQVGPAGLRARAGH